MKTYNFDDKDSIAVLLFLAQFKWARDSIEVRESTALWIMPTFKKDGPAYTLIVWMTSYKDDGTTHELPKAGEEQISTYVETVNFLL